MEEPKVFEEKTYIPDGYVELTQENLLTRFNPVIGEKVFTKAGDEITEKSVLAVIKELKLCIIKNDSTEFCRVLDDGLTKNLNTREERLLFYNAVIAGKRVTVQDFILDLDDLDNP